MATNSYRITPANWDGQHGTGWHENLAGEGRHGQRAFLAQRWARRGPAPVSTPFVLMKAPPKVLGDVHGFTEGWIEAEAPNGFPLARIAGAAAGGIVAAAYVAKRAGR